MGLFDKFLDAVRLNDEYDEDEDEFFDDDDFEEEEEPEKKHFFKRTSSQKEKEPVEEPADRDEEAPVLKTRPEPNTRQLSLPPSFPKRAKNAAEQCSPLQYYSQTLKLTSLYSISLSAMSLPYSSAISLRTAVVSARPSAPKMASVTSV